jgi:hypothetical protein
MHETFCQLFIALFMIAYSVLLWAIVTCGSSPGRKRVLKNIGTLVVALGRRPTPGLPRHEKDDSNRPRPPECIPAPALLKRPVAR